MRRKTVREGDVLGRDSCADGGAGRVCSVDFNVDNQECAVSFSLLPG